MLSIKFIGSRTTKDRLKQQREAQARQCLWERDREREMGMEREYMGDKLERQVERAVKSERETNTAEYAGQIERRHMWKRERRETEIIITKRGRRAMNLSWQVLRPVISRC